VSSAENSINYAVVMEESFTTTPARAEGGAERGRHTPLLIKSLPYLLQCQLRQHLPALLVLDEVDERNHDAAVELCVDLFKQ